MFRRPVTALMSNKASRTIIRDPRKTKRIMQKAAVVAARDQENNNNNLQVHQPSQAEVGRPRMSFEPSVENQRSLGLGSYMLAGVGVAMGVTLVGAIFGAIG